MSPESITKALLAAKGNVRKASRALGVTHPTLYKWMRRHRISASNAGGNMLPHAETAETVSGGNDSSNSFESNGQGGGKARILTGVATQAAMQPTMTEPKGRAPRTVYMADEENQALLDAGIDLAFYTRHKQSLSDVVVLLIRGYLPALLRDARKADGKKRGGGA